MRLKKYLITEAIKEKSGVVPYHKDEIMLMIPSNPAYGGSDYQIAKGNVDANESLEQAAIREGTEELGLKTENITNTTFVASDIIKGYNLSVYATEVIDKQDFEEPHYETGSVKWLSENEIDTVREEHQDLVGKVFSHIKNLNEWKVHKQYAGRHMMEPGRTILWQYLPDTGLMYSYPDGTTYLNGKKIGKMIRTDDPNATHKKQLDSFYKHLGFQSQNRRQYIEEIYENFVRGRIVGKDIYVYSTNFVGMQAKKYNKFMNKAIDAIYKYIEEDYIV